MGNPPFAEGETTERIYAWGPEGWLEASARQTITTRTVISLFARLGLILVIFQGHGVLALEATRQISQYAHTAWRTQDGFLSGAPNAIVQTPDGYIWIGTQAGLLRFDGVRFVPWTPPDQRRMPSPNVTALLADRDGSLWIGTASGLVHWKDEAWSTIPDLRGRIATIAQDDEGAIWVAQTRIPQGEKPLCQVNNARTQCYGAADGVPLPEGEALALGAYKNLWLGGANALLQWKPGSSSFHPIGGLKGFRALDGVQSLAPAPDGSVWVGLAMPGAGGLQQFVQGKFKTFVAPRLNGRNLQVIALYLDREANLWVGTYKQGLYRIHGSSVDHFASADGLSGDQVNNFFEDREGTLWIATSKGLDSFRDRRVVSFSTREGLNSDEVNSVLATRDGAVWMGNVDGLDVLRSGSLAPVNATRAIAKQQITALLEDHAGQLWVGVRESMLLYRDGRVREIRRPDGSSLGLATGITEDADHNIWIEVIGPPRTLIRIQDLRVKEMFPVPQMPAARKLAADPQGGIWLGLMSGDLARYRNGTLQTYSYDIGSRVDQVLVAPDGSVFGATAAGLIAWRDGKKQVLTNHNGMPCDGVNAIMLDRENDLWLYTQCGLVRISAAELLRWWAQADSRLQMRVFDSSDGVQIGTALFNMSAMSIDGRLWFPNSVVLQMIDPSKLDGNKLAPPVHIEAIIADRRTYSPQPDMRLPSLTHDLEIDYTALSFVAPLKVRFRYRLDGHDPAWQEAGTRRQAFYDDLPPGKYLFRVIACNNDGVWNETGAVLHFAIMPSIYQTTWFKLLLALSGFGLICLLHTLRLRQATAQTQARLGERLEERGRIARELHDTLIQSVDGLMLRLQTALDEPDSQRSHQMIEKALDSADEVMDEGRQRVQALRAEAIIVTELSAALAIYGNELAEIRSVAFFVSLVGSPRPVNAFIRDEAYRIAREAIGNAFQHSTATRIEAEITYDHSLLRVQVRDDGVGINPQILEGGKPGHYGLTGMRERTQAVGGRLVIWSRSGAGTEIDLEIPAKVAYQNSLRGFSLYRIRRLMGPKGERR